MQKEKANAQAAPEWEYLTNRGGTDAWFGIAGRVGAGLQNLAGFPC